MFGRPGNSSLFEAFFRDNLLSSDPFGSHDFGRPFNSDRQPRVTENLINLICWLSNHISVHT